MGTFKPSPEKVERYLASIRKDKQKAKKRQKNKRREYKVKRRNVVRNLLFKYLKNNPCVDCGEMDFALLQFDHIKGNKVANISRMVQQGLSWGVILNEIEKCEVVCANCHHRRTAKQQKWYSTFYED